MPQFAVLAQTGAAAVPLSYTYLLGLAGIAALGLLPPYLWRRRDSLACDLRPWSLGWLDFLILIWLLFAWMFVAGATTNWLMPFNDGAGGDYKIWRSVAGDVVSQVGMGLLFLGYRLFLPFNVRAPLSSRRMGWRRSAVIGAAFFLATIPPIWALGLGWAALLNWINTFGFNLNLEQQLLIGYFSSATSPWAFGALVLLAVVVAPIVEELIFRGGIYRFMKAKVPAPYAAALAASFFAALHFNVLSFPSLLLLGLALTLAYELTGSIRVPIVFHALFNLNTILLILLNPTVA